MAKRNKNESEALDLLEEVLGFFEEPELQGRLEPMKQERLSEINARCADLREGEDV